MDMVQQNEKQITEQKIKEYKTYNEIIPDLIRKYKDGMKIRKGLKQLDQPVMILLRRSNYIEFIEANKRNRLKNGKFVFKHSTGEEREVKLMDSYLHTGAYFDDTAKFYIMHEDWAFPMPPKPLIEAKEFKNAVENAMSAEMKWKAEEKKATAKQIMAIAVIIAIIVGGVILWTVLKPSPAPTQIIVNGTVPIPI